MSAPVSNFRSGSTQPAPVPSQSQLSTTVLGSSTSTTPSGRQQLPAAAPTSSTTSARHLIVSLHNIRSTHNVGAILRTCDGFGVAGVILSGYTPRPHDTRLLPHLRAKVDHAIHKTALGAEDTLTIHSSDDIISILQDYRQKGYHILGLENNLADKTPISLYNSSAIAALGSRLVLILGEEVAGIDYSLHDIIDTFLEIPMRGQKESFNVSVATGIALFALTRPV